MLLTKKTVLFMQVLCLVFVISIGSFAENTVVDSAVKYLNNNMKINGYGSYEFGEVVKGDNGGGKNLDHFWSHQVYAGLGFTAALNPQIELVAGIEGKMWNPFPNTDLPGRGQFSTGYSLWLTGVYGAYSPFGGIDNSWLDLTAGYFPYKYNPDVHNLGEYIFRSSTYPGIIMNYFDFPANRLLGLKLHANIADDFFGKMDGKFKSDLLITEEDQNWPIGDISISWLGSLNIKKVFEIGAGVDFANCISVNGFNTSPKDPSNMMVLSQDSSSGKYIYDSTSYYTFKAVKPMARVNIDFKQLWGYQGQLFGQEDLKLYGEACIIGAQNYSFYYDNMNKRTPIMLGFNVPAFKILDLLNVEVEYYSSPLSTSYENQVYPQVSNNRIFCIPVPAGILPSVPDYLRYKWSVYIKKTLMSRVSCILQFSHDHYRINYTDGNPVYNETLLQHGAWRWVFKIIGAL
jgi:hypothetical protein